METVNQNANDPVQSGEVSNTPPTDLSSSVTGGNSSNDLASGNLETGSMISPEEANANIGTLPTADPGAGDLASEPANSVPSADTQTANVELENTPGEPEAASPVEEPVEEKVDPLTDLHDTYHSMKGSMSAAHSATLGSKISNVISFFEGHYADHWKKQVQDAEERATKAEQELELNKESVLQAENRIAFYEKQLDEANQKIKNLTDELKMVTTEPPVKNQ